MLTPILQTTGFILRPSPSSFSNIQTKHVNVYQGRQRGRGHKQSFLVVFVQALESLCSWSGKLIAQNVFVYDKKYAHKIHSLNQGPLPPSVYLIHRIKYLRYFPILLIKTGQLESLGTKLPDYSLLCSPSRQHSNLTTCTAMQFHLVGEMVTCCYSFRASSSPGKVLHLV